MGAALGVLDNLPQLLRALAPADTPVAAARELGHTLVVCFSVSNTLGRIGAGYLSEAALHSRVRRRRHRRSHCNAGGPPVVTSRAPACRRLVTL
jgi:hypothetical protein